MKTKSKKKFDFGGWATMNDLRCSDGRTIRKNAFADDDGRTVPLVYMHQHKDPMMVMGHALLENKDDGVYAYCSFNNSDIGRQGREIVSHGDVCSLSIWANNLEQKGGNVLHGSIKEVSIVLAGANPGAVIDYPILAHSGEEDYTEAMIRVDAPIRIIDDELRHSAYDEDEDDEDDADENADDTLSHEDDSKGSDDPTVQEVLDSMTDKQREAVEFLVGMALEGEEALAQAEAEMQAEEDELSHADGDSEGGENGEETVQEILDTMNDTQRQITEYLVDLALQQSQQKAGAAAPGTNDNTAAEVAHSDEESEENEMSHTNTFEAFGGKAVDTKKTLSHADGVEILKLAKEHGGMSLRAAMGLYAQENDKDLMHADTDLGFKDIDTLFPEYALLNGPAPEMLTTDQGWIGKVMSKTSKSPKSRVKVRFADARDITNRRAQGYKKGQQKQFIGNLKLLQRKVDPTTVYILEKLDRDDTIDITDFNLVDYMYKSQKMNLQEELARAIMIGDGRNGDAETETPIDTTSIIPIWGDDALFTIHQVVDVNGMRTTMNGSNSSANFGDNYVYSEAIIQSLLYAREDYKGSGAPDFYCTPHLVNVMLLARDLNGRRIYDNVNELRAAMNVNELITCEQFANKTRKVTVGGVEQTRRLLGILVNLKDYEVGATKGGEVTHFTDFDIRFNQNLSLLETRCSGMLVRPYSAIVLEEIVSSGNGGSSSDDDNTDSE